LSLSEVVSVAEDPVGELKAMRAALEALAPLDEEGRGRAVAWLAGALGISVGAPAMGGVVAGRVQFGAGLAMSSNGSGELGAPKEFLAYKAPKTDVERVAVLAYYLTHARAEEHFATKRLNELNTEAAGPRFSNAAYAASNAVKKNGYLTAAPGGKRQITARGEALVNALPDREAAKAALESMPGKPRRSTGANRKRKTDPDSE
jgi:hypothetical protein